MIPAATSRPSRSARMLRAIPRSLEIVEAPHAEKCVAQQEDCPAVADHVERVGHRAVEVIERLAYRHRRNRDRVAFCNGR